jgi:hypothetical protein
MKIVINKTELIKKQLIIDTNNYLKVKNDPFELAEFINEIKNTDGELLIDEFSNVHQFEETQELTVKRYKED